MMIKRYTYLPGILLAVFIWAGTSFRTAAQVWQSKIQDDANFFSVQKAFYADSDNNPKAGELDGENELYKRWENFMRPRVNPDGSSIAPDIIYKEWAKYQATRGLNKTATTDGSWRYLGPIKAPAGGGTGRINCITFTPGNPNVMWAGTASGGLWKSTNAGLNWTTNTDNLPDLGVTDVAINPRNPDTMFMATGDGFGYVINNGTHFGGTYSNGVMRSINGGQTWDTTGLNWSLAQVRQITHLLIIPENPNIVLATTNAGLFRTSDGGNTWTQVSKSTMTGIVMNSGNHGILYAVGTTFYISNDTGATWKLQAINIPAPAGAMAIATTQANPAYVYVTLYNGYANQGSNVTLLKSTDSAKTWKNMGAIAGTTFYGYYTSELSVSPYDSNDVIAGGVDVVHSLDGGATWGNISSNVVHSDHRILVYYPGSKDTMYDGDDGGMYRSTDGGNSWRLVSADIHALEFYRMGSSISDTTILYAGAQDNGVNEFYKGVWRHVIGGDGEDCKVSPTDPAVAYGSWQNGNFERTLNYGSGWQYLNPPGTNTTNWTTPLVIDPVNSDSIYFGGLKLYQSPDEGNSWGNMSAKVKINTDISCIAISPTGKNEEIYVGYGSDQASVSQPNIYRTSNMGQSWINCVDKVVLRPVKTYQTGIDVEKYNPATVAACFSGFVADSKVFLSKDSGATWTNISAGLPNVPVDCIKFEGSIENGIYVGTDIGVFYRNDNTNGWVPFNGGLPYTIVDQIEVFPVYNKIRACTFGRGIWDGKLYGTFSGIEKINELKTEIDIYPNPSTSGVFNIQIPQSPYKNPTLSVYNTIGKQMVAPYILSGMENGGKSQLDLSSLPNGIYFVNLSYPDGVISSKVQVMK